MRFANRTEAGKLLGKTLAQYAGKDIVVYALPRGGVVIGYEVARALGAPLELIIARKIGHPDNPEYAVCATTEAGELVCNEEERTALDPEWLRRAVQDEQAEARRRRLAYSGVRPFVSSRGKIALIVDDGIATGLTLRAALRALDQEKPKEKIVAVPVAPSSVAQSLRSGGSTVVTLHEPEGFFGSIGSFYNDFSQVGDATVINLLRRSGGSA